MTTDLPDMVCPGCGVEVLDIDVKCPECGAPLASTGAQRLVGTVVLDQYEIVEVLGQGGMSVVYHAKHKLTEQAVALKILPPELARHTQVKSRFLEEAKALAQLDHPNIVHLYNFGEDQGCFVLAMQFVEGHTWERMILEDEEPDWREHTRIAIDVLKALEYAHERGIVHRDMKPSNVLVRDSDGSATVMDFGIAKMTTSSRLTATGQTMGTVRYMSPEQVRGQEVDLRTDIYSLSCTLYEALIGDTPFDGETHFEIMTKHLSEPPPGLIENGVECPPELEGAVLKGLAKKRDSRFASALEFRELLEGCLAGNASMPEVSTETLAAPAAGDLPMAMAKPSSAETPIATPAASGVRERPAGGNRTLMWLTAVCALLAAGAGVFYWTQRENKGKSAQHNGKPVTPQNKEWPDPVLLPSLNVTSKQTFEADRIRVLSELERDLAPIRDSLTAGRDEFVELLREQDVSATIIDRPLNVVVVSEGAWFCRKEMYRGRAPAADCGTLEYHFRPFDRTVYIRDNENLAMNLKLVQADYICVYSKQIPNCEKAVVAYANQVMGAN